MFTSLDLTTHSSLNWGDQLLQQEEGKWKLELGLPGELEKPGLWGRVRQIRARSTSRTPRGLDLTSKITRPQQPVPRGPPRLASPTSHGER